MFENFYSDGSCGNSWICEHRWKALANMVQFRNLAGSESVQNWWDDGGHQIAFSRGNKGMFSILGVINIFNMGLVIFSFYCNQ
jgi:hypothetical protein